MSNIFIVCGEVHKLQASFSGQTGTCCQLHPLVATTAQASEHSEMLLLSRSQDSGGDDAGQRGLAAWPRRVAAHHHQPPHRCALPRPAACRCGATAPHSGAAVPAGKPGTKLSFARSVTEVNPSGAVHWNLSCAFDCIDVVFRGSFCCTYSNVSLKLYLGPTCHSKDMHE